MSECKVYRREIDEAADGGQLSTGARVHAAHCRACGEALGERERLRALVGGLGRVEAPADFEFRLRARMAAAKADGGRGRFSGARWFYGFAPVAVAACFVVVSATLYFRQASQAPKTNTPVVASSQAGKAEPAQAAPVNTERESEVKVKEVAEVNPANAVPPRAHKLVHRASESGTRPRDVASKGEGRTEVATGTLESSVTGAQVIHLSPEPLRVILRDERGAERVVPMRSVSFGSQDILARGAATRPAVNVEVGGVW